MSLLNVRLFAAPIAEPRARRASDGIGLAIALFCLAILGVVAVPPSAFERALATFLSSFPDFLDVIWQSASDLLVLAAIAIVVASAIQGRGPIVRDLVVGCAIAIGVALVLGYLVTDEWLPLWDALRSEDPPPWFPAVRFAAAATVVLTASPHLSRPIRRLAVWLVAVAALSAPILGSTTPSGALAGWLIAVAAGSAVHLMFGSSQGRPGLTTVTAALAELGITARSLDPADRQQRGVFLVRGQDEAGEPLLMKVYGRDAHDTQLLATLWRTVWFRQAGSPLTFGRRQQVANEGFATLLAAQAGVQTDTVMTAGVTAEDDALLVLRPTGTAWARVPDEVGPAEVTKLWTALARLRDAGLAHGQVDAEHIVIVPGGGGPEIGLVDFRGAAVGASEDQLLTDAAQALVTSALAIGTAPALEVARVALGDDGLAELLPFLQPPILTPVQRHAVKHEDLDLDDLRSACAADLGVEAPELQQLRRVTWGTAIQAVMLVIAFFALFRVVSGIDLEELGEALQDAAWWLIAIGFVVAQTPRFTQALSTLGASPIPLPLGPVYALQLAASYINLVIPASAARIAVNVRFMQRHGLPTGTALAVGALDGVCGFVVQALLLLSLLLFTPASLELDVSGAASGAGRLILTIAGAAIVAIVLILVVPKWRRSAIERVKHLLADAASALQGLRSPRRLGLLFGGSLATEIMFALALGIMVRAFGYSIGLGELILINVSVALLAGLLPIPGGIGVTEGGLIYGLVAAGVPETAAFAAVIVYRIASFYVPPIWGFFAFRWLERNKHL
jgi:glycosyltransferase 2 family protein